MLPRCMRVKTIAPYLGAHFFLFSFFFFLFPSSFFFFPALFCGSESGHAERGPCSESQCRRVQHWLQLPECTS